MHHAAAKNLDPTGSLADRAAGTLASDAADIDLGARLGVRKEARAEADLLALTEQRLRHREQRALEMGKRDAGADDEPLDLMEHRRVGEIEVVATIDGTNRDETDR